MAASSKRLLCAAKKKAEALYAQAKAGEDFAKLAAANSDDPGSKEQGGDLGAPFGAPRSDPFANPRLRELRDEIEKTQNAMQRQRAAVVLGIGNVLWADEGFGVRAIEALHAGCHGTGRDQHDLHTATTQRRHLRGYNEVIKRIHDGVLGEIAYGRCYWNGGEIWVVERQAGWTEMEWQLRRWLFMTWLSGDFIVEQDCHNFDVLHWFLEGLPIRAVGYAGTKVRTTMEILDHLTLSFEFANGIHVNFEANQVSPPGFNRIGEEFSGTKGLLATSRARMPREFSVNRSVGRPLSSKPNG